jgi:pimeloyl-ACP methyl ester carboxylesterase
VLDSGICNQPSCVSLLATVRSFQSWDETRIAYEEWGEQSKLPPVVLHHGFVADAQANWVGTGVVDALVAAGHRVVALDARGHGRSEKPHDPARYGEQRMARDLAILLDTIGARQVDLVGYSMGAIVVLILTSKDKRVRRLVIGGVGSGVIECGGVDRRAVSNESIIEALSVDDPASIDTPEARAFRMLADALDGDRDALVAQAQSIYRGRIALDQITAPTLLLAGEADPLAVRPHTLTKAIPNATLQPLTGNHVEALGDPRFTHAIIDFLA